MPSSSSMRTVEDVRAWLAKLDRDGLQLDAERSPLAEVLRKKLEGGDR